MHEASYKATNGLAHFARLLIDYSFCLSAFPPHPEQQTDLPLYKERLDEQEHVLQVLQFLHLMG